MMKYRIRFDKKKQIWVWNSKSRPKMEELLALLFLNELVMPKPFAMTLLKCAQEMKMPATEIREGVRRLCEKRGFRQAPRKDWLELLK